MNWTKLGRVFDPENGPEWLASHSTLPVPYHLEGDRYRVYFAGRNERNMSQVGYVEFDLTSPQEVLAISEEPVLHTGRLGTFDDSGVFPSCIVEIDDTAHLYYVGWMQAERIRYFGACGLARSTDGGDTFQRVSEAPLLPRSEVDPYMTLSSFVSQRDDGYEMWYTSTEEWRTIDGETVPLCNLKYAESDDGIEWNRTGIVSVDLQSDDETRIARPCVVREGGTYRMWYSYASGLEGYRVGYAESKDGRSWRRLDKRAGLDVSADGWDSEMVAYPYVFVHKGTTYALYNGNGYGETGFGIAKLVA